MANELTLNATIQYSDATGTIDQLQAGPNLQVTVTTTIIARLKQSVGFASAAALNLGNVASLGWVMIKNLDPTNSVNILTGTGGIVFATLKPGEFCMFRFGSGVTAPFVQALVAACVIDVLLCSA